MFFTLFPQFSASLTDHIFYQSAGWPPLAAPAQTLKPVTANTSLQLVTNAAAAASAHLGSTLLVSPTRPPEPDSGRSPQLVLQTAVAARVSGAEKIIKNLSFVKFNLKDCFPQVLSLRQTTLKNIPTTSIRQRQFMWRVGKF